MDDGETAARQTAEVRKTAKSRDGCQRCKTKRLKCDETKPQCKNCLSRNVSCPGYQKSLKWSTKYEVFKPPRPDIAPNSPSISTSTRSSDLDSLTSLIKASTKSLTSGARNHARPAATGSSASQESSLTTDSHPPTGQRSPDEAGSAIPSRSNVNLEDFPPSAIGEVNRGSRGIPKGSRESRSLLRNYYRLPDVVPGVSLHEPHTMLVEHYFRNVCALYSAFDSPLNPFRVTIGRIWDSSPSIYYAIQSMAAAQLANNFPQMTGTGIEMQRKAYQCLQHELQLVHAGRTKRERILLAILLLGLTACWHDSGDLGLSHLSAARSLILPMLLGAGPTEDRELQRQNQFFEESLIYWEMLIGFVSQDSIRTPPESQYGLRSDLALETQSATLSIASERRVPHPWTGVAPKIQMLFAEVGRLVRDERISKRFSSSSCSLHMRDETRRLDEAAALEEELLAVDVPRVDELIDPGDKNTSKQDFLIVAEAYRCAGLLEIYRVFPDILRKRLGTHQSDAEDHSYFTMFSLPRFQTSQEPTDIVLWINSLALHILRTLESIPSSSGTCFIQLILLVTASAELRFVSSLDYFDIYANDAKVLRGRQFVEARLNQFARRLPAKPLWRMLELIKEVWWRLDKDQEAFWLDVMFEKGWQTVMG